MARSRLFLLVGLLVAGMAIPALAADPIKLQFAATNPYDVSVFYSGSNSPGVATGDFSSSDTYWNPVFCNANWYLNNGFPYGGHPLKYSNGADGASAAGIVIEGAGNIGYNCVGWAHPLDDPYSNAGQRTDSGLTSGFYATNLCKNQFQTDWANIGLQVKGLPAGKYRVYAIVAPTVWNNFYGTPPANLENVSIGVNLTGPLSANVLCSAVGGSAVGGAQSCGGINEATDNAWVAGLNYVTKDVTISGPTDYIGVISWSINGIQIIQLPNLLGDADRNGKVDFQDYLALESSFGNTVTPGTGADFDNNGVVNFQDYLTLESNFGAGTVIPEPMTLSLLGLGGLALIRRRK